MVGLGHHICSEYGHPTFDPFTQPRSRSFVGVSNTDPLSSLDQINNSEQSLRPSFHLLPLPVVFAVVAIFSVVAVNIRSVQASAVAGTAAFIVFVVVEAGLGRLEVLCAPRAPHADQAILAMMVGEGVVRRVGIRDRWDGDQSLEAS